MPLISGQESENFSLYGVCCLCLDGKDSSFFLFFFYLFLFSLFPWRLIGLKQERKDFGGSLAGIVVDDGKAIFQAVIFGTLSRDFTRVHA